MKPAVGPADLIAIRERLGRQSLAQVAEALGFEVPPERLEAPADPAAAAPAAAAAAPRTAPAAGPADAGATPAGQPKPLPFCRLVSVRFSCSIRLCFCSSQPV